MKKIVFSIALFSLSCSVDSERNEGESRKGMTENQDTLIQDIQSIIGIIELSAVNIDTLAITKCGIYKMGKDDESIPGPSDYYLISTFKLRSFNINSFRKVNRFESPIKKTDFFFKEWLPRNIVQALFDSASSKTLVSYSGEIFYKSPYLEGFFILLEDSTVYLNMHTK